MLYYLKMMDSCFFKCMDCLQNTIEYTSYSCLCRKKFLKVEVNQIIPSINNVTRKIEWIGYLSIEKHMLEQIDFNSLIIDFFI